MIKNLARCAFAESVKKTKERSECRVCPRDTRRVRPAAAGTRAMATTLFNTADVLRSQRRSTERSATAPTNDLTECRMHFAYGLRWLRGSAAPAPLRPYARANACRGLPASCFALPGGQRRHPGFPCALGTGRGSISSRCPEGDVCPGAWQILHGHGRRITQLGKYNPKLGRREP
jgi:hypothetical protein